MDADRAAAVTGLPAEAIRQLARDYGSASPSAIRLNYGLNRCAGGAAAVRAIACRRSPAPGAMPRAVRCCPPPAPSRSISPRSSVPTSIRMRPPARRAPSTCRRSVKH